MKFFLLNPDERKINLFYKFTRTILFFVILTIQLWIKLNI